MNDTASFAPVLGAVVGGLLGWGAAVFSEPLRERLFAPRLVIDCPQNANRGETDQDLYIKVRVQNNRTKMAKDCRVFLVGVQEIRDGLPIGAALLSDSFQLPWSGYDFEPRDIPRGLYQFVDIVRFSKHSPGWIFATKPKFYASLGNRTQFRGTYRLAILAAADGTPPSLKQIDVFYDGGWHQA